jgi:hypothetical protein
MFVMYATVSWRILESYYMNFDPLQCDHMSCDQMLCDQMLCEKYAV